jgi:hypothetical protein
MLSFADLHLRHNQSQIVCDLHNVAGEFHIHRFVLLSLTERASLELVQQLFCLLCCLRYDQLQGRRFGL